MLNLKNLSPGKRVAHDARSTGAVGRLVQKARSEVMASRTPGVLLDGSEGSMIELAESLSLQRFIDRHNDPADPCKRHRGLCLLHAHEADHSRTRYYGYAETVGIRTH